MPKHWLLDKWYSLNKGKNKITELQTIFQRESQNSEVLDKQTKSDNTELENCENRNDPDLVQAFPKKLIHVHLYVQK